MAVRNLPKRKRIEPRWVVSEAGEAVAVLDVRHQRRKL